MITFTDVALRRGAKLLFKDGSFNLNAGEKMGLVGGNGAGKSSLFALLRGELIAEGGTVDFPAKWRIAHVAQETEGSPQSALQFAIDGDIELRALEAELAKAEEAEDGFEIARIHEEFMRIDAYSIERRAAELLVGLGFDEAVHENAVSSFSGGWRMRLNLARALMCRSDLLLLDEPTNHLDLEAIVWLQDWLKAFDGTVLMISHDRNFLDATVDRILELAGGTLTLYTGGYSDYENMRAEKLMQQQSLYEKQQRQIAHMSSFINRFKAQASKARQAQSRIKALAKLERVAAAHVDTPFTFKFREPDAMATTLWEALGADAGYPGKQILGDITLNIGAGTRVGLLGRNGAGKSTLIKMIAGEIESAGGEVIRDRKLNIGYFAQHQLETLDPEQSPLWHMKKKAPQAREQELRTYLGTFDFSDKTVFQETGTMSGGEKSRLVLAMIIWDRPNLLLLDEPTNHLDLEVRAALTLALQEFEGAVVLVSHDTSLIETVVDRYWLIDKGTVSEFDGNLLDYKRYRAQADRKAA
ncbi:ABC-F family ATP-binding cassette domain-containing protein [Gimibacter soli]|uniref:Probable ATP-binding protein YheS n=1 Tax=Gimibacter soli TaxID=3024400 RepID=A0AAE9XV43_9PROT|nr:ATP-binding cassette domain-containing protein [Gimibacter soli]WCL54288.1 ATP-binding cassette domain-containing protein [Gimibacter soli]